MKMESGKHSLQFSWLVTYQLWHIIWPCIGFEVWDFSYLMPVAVSQFALRTFNWRCRCASLWGWDLIVVCVQVCLNAQIVYFLWQVVGTTAQEVGDGLESLKYAFYFYPCMQFISCLSINILELPGFPISVNFFLFQSPFVITTAFMAVLRGWVFSFGSRGNFNTLLSDQTLQNCCLQSFCSLWAWSILCI